MMMRIEGGRALFESGLEETSIDVDCESGMIAGIGAQARAERAINASGLLILPGIVDMHGDAFERQMMPRPGVDFAIDIALIDSDRQLIAYTPAQIASHVAGQIELSEASNAAERSACVPPIMARSTVISAWYCRRASCHSPMPPVRTRAFRGCAASMNCSLMNESS